MKITIVCPKCGGELADKFESMSCKITANCETLLEMECLSCGEYHNVVFSGEDQKNTTGFKMGTCDTCIFWQKEKPEQQSYLGTCQRYPPITIGMVAKQPTTSSKAICGEWMDKEGIK